MARKKKAKEPSLQPMAICHSHNSVGQVVLGTQGLSFAVFNTKAEAAQYLRGVAASIEAYEFTQGKSAQERK